MTKGMIDLAETAGLSTFVFGGSSVLGYMRAGRWFLEHCCGGIDYGDIDVEGFGPLDELDVSAHVVGWLIYCWNHLAHYKFHTKVGLLDSRIESLE